MTNKLRCAGFVITLALLTGCGGVNPSREISSQTGEERIHTESEHDQVKDNIEDTQEMAEDNTGARQELTYKELSGLTFNMYYDPASGNPVEFLSFDEDGTFAGSYSYLDTAVADEDNPDGIVYYCDFRGKAGAIQQVNEFTYLLPIEKIEYPYATTEDTIQDGMRYVYREIEDFNYTKRLYLYVPGADLEELPKNFKYYLSDPENEKRLNCYGMFNAVYNCVWTSDAVPKAQITEITAPILTKETAQKEIDICETEAQELWQLANSEMATQFLLNMSTGREYELWDLELNRIWKSIKQTIDEDDWNQLLEEQRAWIKEKDAAIEEAGADWAGGSGEPMARSSAGAKYTKERVYELLGYLK